MSDEWDVKICCMGAGYVGGPTMAIIAHQCPKVSSHRKLLASYLATAVVVRMPIGIADGRWTLGSGEAELALCAQCWRDRLIAPAKS